MAHLTEKPGRAASLQSQHEFQLIAIETGLHKAIACILNGEAANQAQFADCATQGDLTVARTQNCVTLQINNSADSTCSPSLQIAPLFPGSYTQSEITIRGILSDSADKADWAALPPDLYFSRFNSVDDEDGLISDRNGINLAVIMLPETDLADAEKMGQTLRSCPVVTRVTRVTILLLSGSRTSREHEQLRLASRILQIAELPADAKKHCKKKYITDSHSIIHQLGKHDIAVCTTPDLAIDAMNCGCACIVPECTCISLQTLLPANAPNGSASHLRSALNTAACKQRKHLMHCRQGLFSGHLITPWWHELVDVVHSFCLHNHSPSAAIAHPRTRIADERPERVRVISPAANLSQISASQLSTRSASTRRKLLKLYHSPRQFFSDSQRPQLQLIARFLKGIEQ